MRETLTQTVRESLRTELREAGLRPGIRIPTEVELAGRFRVSVTTVRRAVDGLVGDGLLVRRQGSGTYVADRGRMRRDTVAVVIPETKYSRSYLQMATKAEPLLRGRKLRMRLLVAEDIDAFHAGMREAKAELDGLLICGYLIRHQELRREGLPYVVAGTEGGIDADCVAFDLFAGAIEAVKHLIDLGHRNILFFSNRSEPQIEHPRMEDLASGEDPRLAGYRRAMTEAGLEVKPDWLVRAGPSRRTGHEAVRRLTANGLPHATAIFAGNDLIAEGAAQALRELGLTIPGDISLVGCDNVQDEADHVIDLTTIDIRIEDVARQAIELLADRIEHPDRPEFRCVSVMPRLVLRNSTGPPRNRDAG